MRAQQIQSEGQREEPTRHSQPWWGWACCVPGRCGTCRSPSSGSEWSSPLQPLQTAPAAPQGSLRTGTFLFFISHFVSGDVKTCCNTESSLTLRCMSLSHSTERINWMSDSISSVTPSSSSGLASSCIKISDNQHQRRVCFTTEYCVKQWLKYKICTRTNTDYQRSNFNSGYPGVDLWRLDRRGPGWSILHMRMWRISGLWHSAASEPSWCLRHLQVLCGHRCLDQSENLRERRSVLPLSHRQKLEKVHLTVKLFGPKILHIHLAFEGAILKK